jgi:hypothetical protein
MKFHCQITAQRKHRPLYFTSDEQFQWMIAILQHFVPDINLELDGLKALGSQLGVVGPAPPPPAQTPMRNLPPSLERAYGQTSESASNPSERMAGRSQSPTSELDGEEELNMSEDLVIPNAESLHPSSPTRTRNFFCLLTLTLVDNQLTLPSQRTSPNYSFSSVTVGALPNRALADVYVENYFNDINDIIWVLSYNEFMSWYRDYDPNIPLDATKHTILSLVFAFGAKEDSNNERDMYYSNALKTIGSVMKQGGLHSIQALMLMVGLC